MTYTARTFSLPALNSLSPKQIEAHLGLYAGYVKQVNFIGEQLAAVRSGERELDPYVATELRRRFAFEFDGMRLHEQYFEQFENGPTQSAANNALVKIATEKYGKGGLEAHVREVAQTRGIGWVVTYYDPAGKTLQTVFVESHERGHLAGLPVILVLDLWEHAFMVDYLPAEKGSYVDAFFKNLNWGVIEERFEIARATKASAA